MTNLQARNAFSLFVVQPARPRAIGRTPDGGMPRSTFGVQAYSTRRSSPAHGFGSSTRTHASKHAVFGALGPLLLRCVTARVSRLENKEPQRCLSGCPTRGAGACSGSSGELLGSYWGVTEELLGSY